MSIIHFQDGSSLLINKEPDVLNTYIPFIKGGEYLDEVDKNVYKFLGIVIHKGNVYCIMNPKDKSSILIGLESIGSYSPVEMSASELMDILSKNSKV